MPFTFSHPAAVLPFTFLPRSWYSLTGLIIGSIVPDFEYFIRMKVYSSISHTWIGLIFFDLPLSLILAFIFHLIIRNALLENLPSVIKHRVISFSNFNWTYYFKSNSIIVIISCLVGSITHIIWDSFTHQHGQYVEHFSSLQKNIHLAGYQMPLFKLLQHLSTIVGALCIWFALIKIPYENPSLKSAKRRGYWITVLVIALIVVALRIWIGSNPNMGNIIVTIIAGGIMGLTITPLILKGKRIFLAD